MKSRTRRSPARGPRSRLPTWVTVLGMVLVLGELTGGAVLLAGGRGGLGALGLGTRTVVLTVDGACAVDAVTYRTPTRHGQFDITAGTSPEGIKDCFSHGGFTGPTLTKTVAVRSGGTVTISIFERNGVTALSCSITVSGRVLDHAQVEDGRAACRARIP